MTARPKAPTMSIDELFRGGRAITAATNRAVRLAIAENERMPVHRCRKSLAERKGLSVAELFRDGRAIDAAAKRAVRRAVAEFERESAASAAAKKKGKARRVIASP